MINASAPLVLKTVNAGYGKKKVLNELSLEVPQGSICALLGRNGAGKTTLLRTALGFLRTVAGRIEVLGLDAWTHRYELKDRIGYVAERQDLWPRMRGGELLSLASKLFSQWDEELAARLIKRYNLPLGQAIKTYSNGMQVQIAQVVALAHRPELLILDEPVASMDPVVRSEFTEHVLGYVHDTGASVLYSTHLVDEVETLADRVAFLHGGKIILAGQLDEVIAQFARLLVALDANATSTVAELGWVMVQRREDVAAITVSGEPHTIAKRATQAGLTVLEARRPSLQELFIALLGEDNPYIEGSYAYRQKLEVAS
jgi:ABC-2 type transport system ATP-binding protein